MIHTRKNKGVCSSSITVELDGEKIKEISIEGGCEGNSNGLCSLLPGLDASHVIERFSGVKCEGKPTSCPDQIALCLKEALKK